MSRKRILISIFLVVVVVWLVWQFHHSPEWKQFSLQKLWTATSQAEGWYIAGSVVLIYASYLIRTWRWQALMSPHGRFKPVLKGTVVGFTSLAFLGRAGELVRPYYIGRKHSGLPPQLAVWVIERVFDMAGVVLLVGLDLVLSPSIKQLTRSNGLQSGMQKAGIIIMAGVAFIVILLVLFHRHSRGFLAFLHRRQERHPWSFRKRYMHFLEMLAEGLEGLRRGKTLLFACAMTVLLWVVVSGSMWAVVRAYPHMLPSFALSGGVLLMGLTAIGSVAQLPAVGGGFQVLTIFGLTKIFGAETTAATSAALVIWLVCFYAIAPWGVGLATHEGVSWRGLEEQAQDAEQSEPSP
ncbi:MAG: lysylphosphatidylglycerol synthase transmembrane domain-containing protein [Terriglobales bacterium]